MGAGSQRDKIHDKLAFSLSNNKKCVTVDWQYWIDFWLKSEINQTNTQTPHNGEIFFIAFTK